MLYSAMLTVPRGKYCAELQAQCHVKTGPAHVRTGPDLDQTRIKNNLEWSFNRTRELLRLVAIIVNNKKRKMIIIIIMMIKYKSKKRKKKEILKC